jgi:hypothetical protein
MPARARYAAPVRSGIALLVLASCVTERLYVTPREILEHGPELRATGHAHVDTGHGTYDLDADRTYAVMLDGRPQQLSVAQMIAGCRDAPPFVAAPRKPGDQRCLLGDTTVEQFPVETRHHIDWEIFEMLGAGLLITTVIGSIGVLVCEASSDGCP